MLVDNPVGAPAHHEGQRPSLAKLTMWETMDVKMSNSMMLLPPPAPRYLLVPDSPRKQLRVFDLLRPSGPGVAVLHGEEMAVFSAALSADGGSICLGCTGTKGGLRVYDSAPLLAAAASLLEAGEAEANDQIIPRALAPQLEGQGNCSGAKFSPQADKLFVLWVGAGGVTVHDPWQPNLPKLRSLSFNGPPGYYCNSMLACTGTLLAAAAGGGVMSKLPVSVDEARSRSKVRLWRVDAEGETELRTVSNPDVADSVAISPSGDLIAIGLRNGAVRLMSAMAKADDVGEEQDVYLAPELMGDTVNNPMAHTLCFSHDGSRLAVGREVLDDFTVYDVASAAVVSRFVLPGTKGFEATFFPADDILLTGTVQQAQQCVFHSLRPPAPSFELTISTGSIAHSDVAWDGELGSPVVALATSSQLNVFTTDQKRLMHNDFGEEITTLGSKSTSAVRMQPGGKLVACVVGAHSVVVVSVEDGSELFRATIACTNLRWSPDGSWLALGTYQGVQILSANADFADVQRLEDGQIIPCLHFTSDGLQLAIGTLEGRITIWEVGTWTPTRTLELQQPVFMINFNNKGDQLA